MDDNTHDQPTADPVEASNGDAAGRPGSGRSTTPGWIAALAVTALLAAGITWFVTDRSQSDDLGQPTSATASSTAASSTAASSTPQPSDDSDSPAPSWLFAMTASGATYSANQLNPDVGTLTLSGVDPQVTGFTDRPVRDKVSIGADGLVSAWPTLFADSDPNAVLVARDASGTPASYVLELSSPTVDGTSVTFQVGVVGGKDHSSLVPGMTAVAATPPPASLGQLSLFIDDVRPGQTWICVGSDGRQINPPAPIPYSGSIYNTDSQQFQAQCYSKHGKPEIWGVAPS